MMVRAGLAAPIPTVAQRRRWELIDDRIPPEGEADGEFASHTTWVNKAASWIGYTGAKCFDKLDRPCRNGGDMKRANDEDAFPVRWYWPERFDQPVVPPVSTMRIRKAVADAGQDGMSLADLRGIDGLRNIPHNRVEAALEGRADKTGERWFATQNGTTQTLFEIEKQQRASWIRA